LLINCFRAFYTSITETKFITYNAIFLTVTNILFAYTFIFGKFGFEAQGIAGAGTASALAEMLAFVFIAVITIYKKDIKSFHLFRFRIVRKPLIKSIVNISTPIFFQNLLSMGAWFLFFVFIEQLGEHELAISNLVRSSYMVLMTPIWGYSTAANSMVSNLIGQKKENEVMTLVKKIATLSLLTTICMFILNLFNFKVLLNIMTSDLGIIEDSISSYIVIWCGMFLFSLSMVGLSAVSGTGKTQVAMTIELVNIFIYIAYSYVTAVILQSQLEIVWGAEITYWLIMGLCAYYYLQTNKWKPIRVPAIV
jgi:Na+-driven multidrug efflux pump